MSTAPPETAALFSLFERVHALSDDDLNEVLDLLAEDMEGLATLLAEHRRALEVMKMVDERIASALIPVVPFGGKEVQGVGWIEVRGGKQRKRFDQARLVSSLAARISDEVCDEDPFAPIGAVVEKACVVMADATGASAPSFTGWRKGVVEGRGLKLDAFADEIEPSPKAVIIR